MHRMTEKDVRAAFVVYVNVTGDKGCRLHITRPGDGYGTRYQIVNAATSIGRSSGPVWCGAAQAWTVIHEFCNGYRDARDAFKRELRGETLRIDGNTFNPPLTTETMRPIR